MKLFQAQLLGETTLVMLGHTFFSKNAKMFVLNSERYGSSKFLRVFYLVLIKTPIKLESWSLAGDEFPTPTNHHPSIFLQCATQGVAIFKTS